MPATRIHAIKWGAPHWDIMLRSVGVAAALSIPIVLYVPPAIPLVWLALFSLPANSPLSPVLPASFEPLIIEAAKYAPPLQVSVVALAMYLYCEYINWRVYRQILQLESLSTLPKSPAAARAIRWFAVNPEAAITIFAFTPLPFWVIRCVAILSDYPVRRFLIATAVGRFPRIFVYAWLGSLIHVPWWVLVAVVVGAAFVALAVAKLRAGSVLSVPIRDARQASQRGVTPVQSAQSAQSALQVPAPFALGRPDSAAPESWWD